MISLEEAVPGTKVMYASFYRCFFGVIMSTDMSAGLPYANIAWSSLVTPHGYTTTAVWLDSLELATEDNLAMLALSGKQIRSLCDLVE